MPSYHLCPDFRIPPPPNGHLELGTILKNLEEDGVQFPLNAGKVVTVPAEAIQPRDGPHAQCGFSRNINDLRSVEGGVFARMIGLGNLSVAYSRSHKNGDILTAEGLLTRTFIPDEDYMFKSLDNPKVQMYVTARRLQVPVYMVTGIMVATQASWSHTESKAKNTALEAGLKDPTTDSTAGANAGYGIQKEVASGVTDSDDFVLGIRVRKIWWKRGIRQTSDRVAGRVLGSGKGKAHISSEDSGMHYIDDFESDDPTDIASREGAELM